VNKPLEFAASLPTAALESDERVTAVGYEAFVQQHCTRLIQSLALITFDHHLAADAAQDAFLQLYLHWDDVRGHSNPVAWLYRVGINRCKDYRRYLARASRLLTRVAADLPPEAESVEWDNRLDALAVLKRLPVRQRTAAALFFEADLSVADIASTMGISEGAVKSHLSPARESLRQVLEVER
jgi:RNA polymerase sigma factor (sigma-70 family)